jgi:hypothetical protein
MSRSRDALKIKYEVKKKEGRRSEVSTGPNSGMERRYAQVPFGVPGGYRETESRCGGPMVPTFAPSLTRHNHPTQDCWSRTIRTRPRPTDPSQSQLRWAAAVTRERMPCRAASVVRLVRNARWSASTATAGPGQLAGISDSDVPVLLCAYDHAVSFFYWLGTRLDVISTFFLLLFCKRKLIFGYIPAVYTSLCFQCIGGRPCSGPAGGIYG